MIEGTIILDDIIPEDIRLVNRIEIYGLDNSPLYKYNIIHGKGTHINIKSEYNPFSDCEVFNFSGDKSDYAKHIINAITTEQYKCVSEEDKYNFLNFHRLADIYLVRYINGDVNETRETGETGEKKEEKDQGIERRYKVLWYGVTRENVFGIAESYIDSLWI